MVSDQEETNIKYTIPFEHFSHPAVAGMEIVDLLVEPNSKT
jgi:hypothetical protein